MTKNCKKKIENKFLVQLNKFVDRTHKMTKNTIGQNASWTKLNK